jgi:hypothetical protein
VKDTFVIGGHKKIYEDLLQSLKSADIATSARHLDLALNDRGEAEVPFFGTSYLVSREGVRRADEKRFSDAIASALIHYILKGSDCRSKGQFVTLAQLAGPLFEHSSYTQSALERPIVKRFQSKVHELLTIAASVGGHPGGEAGLGAVSLIFYLLPHIPLQLIFYDRDDEFPARATLLFDRNATQFIDFEVLAVAVTVFVASLIKDQPEKKP